MACLGLKINTKWIKSDQIHVFLLVAREGSLPLVGFKKHKMDQI